MNKETMVATAKDPDDPEDFDVSVAGAERAQAGRWIRMPRGRLGLSQEGFARTYGIPLADIRQHEIGRHMPPPAVRAYLKVISAEPERVAKAVAAERPGTKPANAEPAGKSDSPTAG